MNKKTILKLLLIPLAFLSCSYSYGANNKPKIRIVNNSPYKVTWVKFRVSNPSRLGWVKDFIIGKKTRQAGIGVRKYHEKEISPHSTTEYLETEVDKTYKGKRVTEIDVRYNVPHGKDKTKEFKIGLIFGKDQTTIIRVHEDSIEAGIIAKAQ